MAIKKRMIIRNRTRIKQEYFVFAISNIKYSDDGDNDTYV